MNIYLRLTREFNEGRLRAIICSGQAVVLHRIAIMSKDGAWILREDDETLRHVLSVLEAHGARYRYGAPLETRWMRGGWSSHFEFREDELRVRTDFFTRPPRISKTDLTRIWDEQEGRDIPFLDPPELAEMKKTNRERDYAVIGELARLMHRRPELELLNSRSARDLIRLSREHPDVSERLTDVRPLLEFVSEGRERLEQELDAERRRLIRLNEARLKAYGDASIDWYALWPSVAEETAGLSLREAHEIVVRRADGVLPTAIEPSRGRA